MSVRVGGAVVALLVAILLVVSNPSPERHKQAIRDEVSRREPVASVLGLGLLGSNLTTYHSFLIGSYTRLDDEVVTVGVLGFVSVNWDALGL